MIYGTCTRRVRSTDDVYSALHSGATSMTQLSDIVLSDPEILGGTIVRVGDRIYDGSVRRRMTRLRRQLIG